MTTRRPEPGEIVFLAAEKPQDPAAVAAAEKLGALLPCVSDGARYAELRERIWGIVTWGPTNLAALIAAHGVPPRLAWLHQSGVGMESIAALGVPAAVTFTNLKGETYYGGPMAEHVLARILEWTKGLPRLAQSQAKGEWRPFEAGKLSGKTAMLLGYGTIGQAVGRRLAAFDMRLLAVRRSGGSAENGVETIDLEAARERLGEADYIVITMPLTDETRGLLGAAEFARMKPDLFLVNVGRAAIIDEAAIASALRAGRIGGAALDVFWREPLAPGDDVWSWPRLAITPHMSANIAGGNNDLIADTAATTLKRLIAGEEPPNRVDIAAGY